MYKKILKADYEFDSPYWDNITQNARVILLQHKAKIKVQIVCPTHEPTHESPAYSKNFIGSLNVHVI